MKRGCDREEDEIWREFIYDLTLKDLDSSTDQSIVVFFEEVKETAREWSKTMPWTDENVQLITDWLGIKDVGTVEFAALFPQTTPKNSSHSTNQSDRRYEKVDNEREWYGNISEELERILRLFLNDGDGWAEESEFVMNRIKVKLILMNRIKVRGLITIRQIHHI